MSQSYLDPLPTLEETFELLTELARDDMGSWWEARERGKSQLISIKVFLEVQSDSTAEAQSLLAEAAAVNALRHPNIVKLVGHGRTTQDRCYVATEHLSGTTLASVLQQCGSLVQSRAIEIGIQILEALSAIHKQGVSHRDLNPHNIILVKHDANTDCVKLTGFGFPRRFAIQSHELSTGLEAHREVSETKPWQGEFFGTPEYVPADHALDVPLGERANLYSVGVLLYEAITGRVPFIAASASELMHMHRSLDPVRPSVVRPDLAILRPLEDLILRALSKDPASRPNSAHDFLTQLTALRREYESHVGADTVRSGSIVSYASPIARAEKRRGARWRPIAVTMSNFVVAFCCMYVAGAWLGHTARTNNAPPPGPSIAPLHTSEAGLRSVPQAPISSLATTPDSLASPIEARPPLEVRSDTDARMSTARVKERIQVQTAPGASATQSTRSTATKAGNEPPAQPSTATSASTVEPPMPDSAMVATEGLERAQRMLARNLVAQACAEGKLAAVHSPNSPAVWDFLGRCFMRLGRPEEARGYYRKYLALAPNSANAQFVRAIIEGGQH